MLALHEPSLTPQDEAYILDAIRSGWVSTGGPYVDRFEKEFAQMVGAPYAISVSNGTVGIQLMIECLKRLSHCKGEFHILAPALTFAATWNAIIHSGGTPILVDVAAGTLNMSGESLRKRILEDYIQDKTTKKWSHKTTKAPLLAIMPAHIMGWTPLRDEIKTVCAETGLPLLEDAAESLGCRYAEGSHVGLDGVASCFSFNGNKILTTGGGGMVVSKDPSFAALAKHLSTTAKTNGLRYDHDQSGFNFRLVNILAALGCSQLKHFPDTLRQKREVTKWYKAALSGLSSVKLHEENSCISNYWINNLIFATETQREAALKKLIDQDIQCRPLWMPGHRLGFIRELQPSEKSFPQTDQMWRQTLSVPSSANLKESDVQRVVDIVKSVV